MSIMALEHESQLGNGTIGGWRKSNPQVESICRVAKVLGVSVDELVGHALEPKS